MFFRSDNPVLRRVILTIAGATLSLCQTPAFAGAFVGGAGVSTSGGPIASTSEVNKAVDTISNNVADSQNDAANHIVKELGKMLGSIREGQIQSSQAASQVAEQQRGTDQAMAQQELVAEAAAEAGEKFGAAGTPKNACNEEGTTAGAAQAQKTEAAVSSELSASRDTYARRWGRPSDVSAYQQGIDAAALTTEAVAPSSGVMNDEQMRARVQATQVAMNPKPTLALPEPAAATPAGVAYGNVGRIKRTRKLLPDRIVDIAQSYEAGSIDITQDAPGTDTPYSEYLTDKFSTMGYTFGSNEDINNNDYVVDGKMSPRSLMRLNVDQYYLNTNRMAQLQDMNEKGILADQSRLMDVQLKLLLRIEEHLGNIAQMLAQETSVAVSKELDDELTKLRAQATR